MRENEKLITQMSPLSNLRRLLNSFWVIGLLVLFSLASEGQTLYTAGPEALGDAGRATTSPLDSHYLNPAALAFTHDMSLGGVFQESMASSATPLNNYAVTVTDNDPDKFAAGGLGYLTRRLSYTDRVVTEQDYSADLGWHLTEAIAVGVQAHRLIHNDPIGRSWAKNNMTIGFLAVPRPWFGLALVGYDFIDDSDQDIVPEIAFGSHFIIMDILRIRADITRQEKKNPNHDIATHLGVEFDLSSGLFLRTGGIWDNQTKQNYMTAGLAFEGPNLSLAYAYKQNTTVDNDVTHTFQAWLNF